MLANIQFIRAGEGPDNSLPDAPVHIGGGPIVLPPLPGIWPKPGEPNLPVDPGFGQGGILHPGGGPIIIQGHPETPIALPPGIYPPLPPPTTGKYAVLILVLGVGYRWLVVDAGELPPGPSTKPITPPAPAPK